MDLLGFLVFVVAVAAPFHSAKALCVGDEFAKLRKGPGTNWEKTWEAVRYTPLQQMGKKSGWYRVKNMDGDIHWIREDLVTTKYHCAMIKNEFAYLRTGPGLQYPKVQAEKGDKYLSFRMMSEQNGWAELEDIEGDKVWVKKDLLWVQ